MKIINVRSKFRILFAILILSIFAFSLPRSITINAAQTTYLQKEYVTDTIDNLNDCIDSSNIVAGTVGEQKGIHPVKGDASSYLIYKIDTINNAYFFTDLTLKLTQGRFAYFFGDFGINCNAYISQTNTFTTPELTIKATSAVQNELSFNFSSFLGKNQSNSVYIKLEFVTTNLGSGYDVSWVCFNNLQIFGEESDTPIIKETNDYTITDTWKGKNYPGNCSAFEVLGMGGDGNPDHGLIVGTWGGTLNVTNNQSGSVIYKLGKKDEIITSANFSFTARFSNRGNNEMHNGDRIYVSISTNNTDYTLLEDIRHTNEGTIQANQEEYNYNVSLETYLTNNINVLYIKIELVHLLALSAELPLWGMCLYQTKVDYSTITGYSITYNLDDGTLPQDAMFNFKSIDSIYTLPTPTKYGFIFNNWTDSDNNIITTFDPSIKKSIELFANWTKDTNTIIIDYQNVLDAQNSNKKYILKTDSEFTLFDLSLKGYNFIGWFDKESDGNQKTSINPSEYDGNITLYARWEEKSYTISYQIPEQVSLINQPNTIKYSEMIDIKYTVQENYYINYIKVNSKTTETTKEQFSISGNEDQDIVVEITIYKLQNEQIKVMTQKFNELPGNSMSWANNVYDFSNVKLIHDSNENAGLIKKSEDASEAYVIYKFNANQDYNLNKIKIIGLARAFDYYKNDAYLEVKTSIDNTNWTTLKMYSATNISDGSEIVSLNYEKDLTLSPCYFIKVEFKCTSGGNDWLVLKDLTIVMSEQSLKPNSDDDPSSTSSSSSVSTSSSSSTSDSSTIINPSSDNQGINQKTSKGCKGTANGFSLIMLFSIALLNKKRK